MVPLLLLPRHLPPADAYAQLLPLLRDQGLLISEPLTPSLEPALAKCIRLPGGAVVFSEHNWTYR